MLQSITSASVMVTTEGATATLTSRHWSGGTWLAIWSMASFNVSMPLGRRTWILPIYWAFSTLRGSSIGVGKLWPVNVKKRHWKSSQKYEEQINQYKTYSTVKFVRFYYYDVFVPMVSYWDGYEKQKENCLRLSMQQCLNLAWRQFASK